MPLLKENFMTQSLSTELRGKIASAMKIENFEPNQKIITYGDQGRDYFILSQGKVKVIVYQPKTDPNDPNLDDKIMFTKELNQGAGFGELALIYNDKRSATLSAIEPCECYVLDGVLCKQMIIQSSMKNRSNRAGFLNGIQLFDKLESQQKLKLVDGLLPIVLKQGDYVFKEGDEGMEFFIIEEGEVDCLKENGDDEPRYIRTLKQGDHFGELALINNDKRSLSIKAKSTFVNLLTLDRDAFTRILGDIESFLKKDYTV